MIGAHGLHSAGFAGAFIDKQFETHGVCYFLHHSLIRCHVTKQLDFLDKKKTEHEGGHRSLSMKR
jgi:hypothetical protein